MYANMYAIPSDIDNPMLQLLCKFGESTQNHYWPILSTSSCGTNYVLNEYENFEPSARKLLNSGHYHCKCVRQISEHNVQDFLIIALTCQDQQNSNASDLPTRSRCGPTSIEFQFQECLVGQLQNPSWCLDVNTMYLKSRQCLLFCNISCNRLLALLGRR